MVYQVEVAGLTPLQLVLVGTALEISAFTFEIPTGVVADVYSRRLSVIIGDFITGIAFVIQAIPSFFTIAFSSALWGLGFTFHSGAYAAWITDEVGAENVGPVFLRAGQWGRFGGLIGIPISVWLAGFGLQIPIIVGALQFIGMGVLLVILMPEKGFTPTPAEERETWSDMRKTLQEGIRIVQARPTLRDFLLIGLFVGLYSEGYDRLWTAHLLEHFSFPDLFGLDAVAWFGVLRATVAILGIVGNEIVRRRLDLADMKKSVRTLQTLYGVMILTLAWFALAGNFWVAITVMIIFDVSRGLTFPIQETWTNQFVDSKVRATVLSVQSQVDALGQTGGGPVLGGIGNAFGIRAAMVTASAILLPILPLYQRSWRRRQGHDPGVTPPEET